MPQKIRMPSSIRPKSYESGIEVSKNLRNTTARKMLSATIPTNSAASHSIALMKRSPAAPFAAALSLVGDAISGSQRRVELGEAGLQRVEHGLRVLADLLDAFGPLRLDRRGRLAPG